jgi:hypothetical protein
MADTAPRPFGSGLEEKALTENGAQERDIPFLGLSIILP